MKLSQKRAISYAYSTRARERRQKFIIEKDGNLDEFRKSKYKTELGYIKKKYSWEIYLAYIRAKYGDLNG